MRLSAFGRRVRDRLAGNLLAVRVVPEDRAAPGLAVAVGEVDGNPAGSGGPRPRAGSCRRSRSTPCRKSSRSRRCKGPARRRARHPFRCRACSRSSWSSRTCAARRRRRPVPLSRRGGTSPRPATRRRPSVRRPARRQRQSRRQGHLQPAQRIDRDSVFCSCSHLRQHCHGLDSWHCIRFGQTAARRSVLEFTHFLAPADDTGTPTARKWRFTTVSLPPRTRQPHAGKGVSHRVTETQSMGGLIWRS